MLDSERAIAAATDSPNPVEARVMVGDRIYEILLVYGFGEGMMSEETLLEQGRRLNADMTEEHGRYFCEHGKTIGKRFGQLEFGFPLWCYLRDKRYLAFVRRTSDGWRHDFGLVRRNRGHNYRLVRRVS